MDHHLACMILHEFKLIDHDCKQMRAHKEWQTTFKLSTRYD